MAPSSSSLTADGFPHIIASILDHLCRGSPISALQAQTVCRAWHETIRTQLFYHLQLGPYGEDYDQISLFARTDEHISSHFVLRLPLQPFSDASAALRRMLFPVLTSIVRYACVLDIHDSLVKRIPKECMHLLRTHVAVSPMIVRVGPHWSLNDVQLPYGTGIKLVLSAGLPTIEEHQEDNIGGVQVPDPMLDSPGSMSKGSLAEPNPPLLVIHGNDSELQTFLVGIFKWKSSPAAITLFYYEPVYIWEDPDFPPELPVDFEELHNIHFGPFFTIAWIIRTRFPECKVTFVYARSREAGFGDDVVDEGEDEDEGDGGDPQLRTSEHEEGPSVTSEPVDEYEGWKILQAFTRLLNTHPALQPRSSPYDGPRFLTRAEYREEIGEGEFRIRAFGGPWKLPWLL